MADQKSYPNNLPPEVLLRQQSVPQPYDGRSLSYPELRLMRYGGGDEELNLRSIWKIVRKRRWMIIGIVMIVTTLVTIDVFRTKPLYEATATIEIGRDG